MRLQTLYQISTWHPEKAEFKTQVVLVSSIFAACLCLVAQFLFCLKMVPCASWMVVKPPILAIEIVLRDHIPISFWDAISVCSSKKCKDITQSHTHTHIQHPQRRKSLFCCPKHLLVGGFNPSEKYESQLG